MKIFIEFLFYCMQDLLIFKVMDLILISTICFFFLFIISRSWNSWVWNSGGGKAQFIFCTGSARAKFIRTLTPLYRAKTKRKVVWMEFKWKFVLLTNSKKISIRSISSWVFCANLHLVKITRGLNSTPQLFQYSTS